MNWKRNYLHVTVVFLPICSLITETRLVIFAIVSIVLIFKRRIFTRKVIKRLFQLTVWTCSRMRTPRLSRRLPTVRLGYVTEMHRLRGPGKTPWDFGTRDEGLEDIKFGTRGHVGRGRGDVKYRDAGDTGCELLSQKSEVNAISVTFLVNMFWWRQPTLPSLASFIPVYKAKTRRRPCIKESETVVLVFLLLKYWGPE